MKILLNIDLNRWQHVIVYRLTVLSWCIFKNLGGHNLPTAREGNVFTRVCLSTIGFMDTGSLLEPCYGAVGMHPTGMLSCSFVWATDTPI